MSKPAPPDNGREELAKQTEQMKKDLQQIQKNIADGQAILRDLQCSLIFEIFKKYNSNRSLQYLSRDETALLPEFIECIIIASPQVGPFLSKHPKASNYNVSSPVGDMASSITEYEDVTFSSRMAKRGYKVSSTTRGLYDWKDRSIHLQQGATLGHAVHEGVHTFSTFTTEEPVFLSVLGSFLYEGVTQIFTDQVISDHQWDPVKHGYQDEVGCAGKLIRDFTPVVVANAYFKKQIPPLAEGVARKLRIDLGQLRRLRNIESDGRTGRELCEKLGYI